MRYVMIPDMKTASSVKDTISMEELLGKHDELAHVPTTGEVLTGSILEKTSNALYVDIGRFGVGVIYGKELFDDIDKFKRSKIGDTVQATIQKLDNEEGYIELSLRSATRERSWEELRRKLDDDVAFESEIIDANKGGLIVRVNGVTGFLPVSQLAPDHYPRVEGGDKSKIQERLQSYVGQMFKIAWQRIDNPSDILSVGEKVRAKVIGIDNGLRISLSIKQLQDDPWLKAAEKYNIGDTVKGKVLKVTPFGGFVKLDKDIHGLIHISEFPQEMQKDPAAHLRIDDTMEFTIISLDPKEHRLGLSLKK